MPRHPGVSRSEVPVDAVFFFGWMLHGSTKIVVRAVALLSAKRETGKNQLIRDELDVSIHLQVKR